MVESLECLPLIKAADAALADSKSQIMIRDLRITQDEARLDTVQKEKDQLESQSWYKSPTLWLLVGTFLGGYLAKK